MPETTRSPDPESLATTPTGQPTSPATVDAAYAPARPLGMRAANRFALFGCLAVSAVHVVIWSAGLVWPVPSYSAYYNRQAEAFARGQTHLTLRPVPGLLALADPYDPVANLPYRRGVGVHDAVLYDGKFYLYWGPVPALLLTAVKPLFAAQTVVGDEWLVLAFTIGTTVAAALLLRRLWWRCFPDRSPAVILFGLLILGLSAPATHLLARPAVYEAAIVGGQCFLLIGLLFGWHVIDRGQSGMPPRLPTEGRPPPIERRATDLHNDTKPDPAEFRPQPSVRACLFAGGSLALAVGCRASLALAVTALAVVVTAALVVRLRDRPRLLVARLAAFGLPLAAGAAALAGYNLVRFGAPLEFGQRYQLTGANYKATPALFAPANAVPGLWSYLARPLAVRPQFPFVRARVGEGTFPDWVTIPPNYETHEPIAGLAVSAPAVLLAGLPLVGTARRRRREPAGLRPLVLMLALAAGLGFAPILLMLGSTQRYLMDVWPCCSILAAVGVWQLFIPGRRPSPVVRAVVCGLTAYSLAIGTLLGVTGYYDHFRTWNHTLYQWLGGE
jgi:hypothetical protein